ncbi:MAG: hypothetical protein COU46_02375 [Candidatus Niyogibacteria bacterium CG10_big_fil_rev_8_21_14_0_10_42_19]|uniref:Uncharacterized protein n=1 Tax=Candidatus Niyogibacteria bacterium CG10_big_fil_rev_8_21_14_0_10_42_19 TaxID=1974725 RepID=A0A2H0TFE1_9BACT|nr:MAG: hypothetical protein COU46_02375 [Candidatus Niyogibacteria bacterium CG10_big_fil_rev_8_21_14_0_10_42_19]
MNDTFSEYFKVEEKIEHHEPESSSKWSWDNLSKWVFYIFVGLAPVLFLPVTIAPVEINKAYISYFLVLVSFIFWLLGRVQEGKVRIPKAHILGLVVLLAIVAFVSGLFSISGHASFGGIGQEDGTVIAFVMFALTAFLASSLFRKENNMLLLFLILFASSIAVFLFQFLHSFLGISLFGKTYFPVLSSNFIGSFNSFGLYWGLIGILSLFMAELIIKNKYKIFYYLITLASIFWLVVVNFNIAWWIVTAFSAILLVYLFSYGKSIKDIGLAPVAFLLISLLFIITPVLGQSISSVFGVGSIDVRPSLESSWNVTASTLEKDLFLGSGPNTFSYDWALYKPVAVNNTPFWAVRFNSGSGYLPTLLATLGLAGGIVILLLIGSLLLSGFRAITHSDEKKGHNMLLMLSFLGTLYLLTAAFLFTPGFLLVLLMFVFIGLFVSQMAAHGVVKEFDFSLFGSSGIGFVSSMVILSLFLASISGLYLLGQNYAGAIAYGKSVRLFNEGDINGAKLAAESAVSLDKNDRYLRSLSDIDVAKLSQILQQPGLSADEVRGQFQVTLNSAIQYAQEAIKINSADSRNWMTLARIYEAVIPFNITGAGELSKSAYDNAITRDPKNPEPLISKAQVEMQSGNNGPATDLLTKANELKSDNAFSRFLLAQLKAREGNLNEAIKETENAFFLSQNDVGILFQLGLLYYQAGQVDNSRVVFERAIELNDNYSNARYFLGLIYDQQGEKEKALAQFQKIEALNPDNQEVKTIISNLEEGKAALDAISPPGPAPEERDTPPLDTPEN